MSEKNNIEKLMSDKKMQFRDFKCKIETRVGEDGEPDKLTVKGCPITFNRDTLLFDYPGEEFHEIIMPTALEKCDMSDVIFNTNHCGRVYARTRNDSLKLEVKDDGLYMSTELWGDDPGHCELYRDIKRGNIDKMSFAFTVLDDEWKEETRDGIHINTRIIKNIKKLYDVSAVDIPAYDTTSISARRAFDAESEKRKAESRKAESRKRALKLKIEIMKRREI